MINKLKIILVFAFLDLNYSYADSGVDPDFLSKMRTLSESRGSIWKIYKSYILLGLKDKYKNPKKVFDDSIKAYEQAIKESEDYVKKNNYTKTLQILRESEKEWKELKELFMQAPSQNNIPQIDQLSMKVTRTIIKALKAMGAHDQSKRWNYLAKTQKAQNIAQRMAALYLDKVYGGLPEERYEKMMKKVTGNYIKVKNLILGSKFVNDEIKKAIHSADMDYQYFKFMWKTHSNHYIPTLIYEKSSDMDKKMGECTTLIYNQLTAK